MSKHIIVTVDFRDQLASVSRPVASLEEACRIIDNEVQWENTVQAYAWNKTNGNCILYCQHGAFNFAYAGRDINIDTFVEEDRI